MDKLCGKGGGRGVATGNKGENIESICQYELVEPVFVDLLRSQGIDSSMAALYDNPICRTSPPGYIGWRNRSIGIDFWAP